MMDVRKKLVELLSKYFDIGDSYCYKLTRTKNAFACGTMGFDDFEEFDEETVADIADHLIANGTGFVTDNNVGSKWISVKDRLPETNGFRVWVVSCVDGKKSCIRLFERTTVRGKLVERFKYPWETITYENITHWMPLPQPPKGE